MSTAQDQLDKAFWGDRLEVDVDLVLKQIQNAKYLASWVNRLDMRPRNFLVRWLGLGEDVSSADRRDAILASRERLAPFMLVDRATFSKRTYAITEVAHAKLPKDQLDLCRIGEDGFDRLGLMWLLYLQTPENLEIVFQIDRIQRKGFARMVLDPAPQLNGHDARTFFTLEAIQAILDGFEKEERSLRESHCAAVVDDGGRYRLFLKRDHKPAFVAHGLKNTFGFVPEWIVMEFESDLQRVHISSDSPDIPLKIANRVAARFFGTPIEYQNECIVASEEEVRKFLDDLVSHPDKLPLVEVTAKNCGLQGSPQIRLSDQENSSLAPAINQLEGLIGSPLAHINDIESIKVFFAKKRIKVIFEEVEGAAGYIVRFADQPFNTGERREFEQMMKDTYSIAVLSTEKRYAK